MIPKIPKGFPSPQQPPRLADFLLKAFLGAQHNDIQGDMAERFEIIRESRGSQEAKRFYWTQTFGCVWPIFIRRLCLMLTLPRARRASQELAYARGVSLGPGPFGAEEGYAPPRWLDGLLLVIYIVCLTTIAWMVWAADCVYGITLVLNGHLLALGMASLVTLPHLIGRYCRRAVIGLTVFVLALAMLSLVDQNAIKALCRLETKIHNGMTQAQVEQMAAEYFPNEGRFGAARWQNDSNYPGQVGPEGTPMRLLWVGRHLMVVTFSSDRHVTSTVVEDW